MQKKIFHNFQWLLLGALLGLSVSWLLFPLYWIYPIAAILGGILMGKYRKAQDEKEAYYRHLNQTKLFFENLSSNMNAGYNFYDGMRKTHMDLENLLEDQALILQALSLYFKSYDSGLGQERALANFASCFNNDFMTQFSESMVIGLKQGAHLSSIIHGFYMNIVEYQDLEEDRKIKLIASRKEQTLLFIMPFILLLAMQVTGLQSRDLSILAIISRLIFLILFILAFIWTKGILSDGGRLALEEFQL